MLQSKQLKAQRNERNLSLLGSNLFLATPLARCPLVVRRNGLNLSTSALRCLAVPYHPVVAQLVALHLVVHHLLVAHLLSSPTLARLHDQWGLACSYALARRASRTRFQAGSIPSVYEPSGGRMIVNQGWEKVEKWKTNGLINAVLAINAVLGAAEN